MRTTTAHWAAFAALTLLLVLLALARPLDHDESQYVAAAALTARGWPPYVYGYLQTPLQPLLFGPLAALFGSSTWPGLRIVNALLGAAAIGFVYRAAREAGAGTRAAIAGAGLFACTDILLFSIGTARNDALPAALMAAALPLIVRAANDRATWWTAALAGLLLAAAGAAKISYALPAAAYGLYALFDRRHRPFWLAAGAVPMLALVGVLFALQPLGFLFGVFRFPSLAPAEYYAALGRPWKLSWPAKAVDTLKFLALGPALPALVAAVRDRRHDPVRRVLDLLVIAGLVAALLPFPTWRQYLLPAMVPLFVRLAVAWSAQPPGRAMRIAAIVFACAGLAPSVEALLLATRGVPMVEAMRQGVAIRTAMDRCEGWRLGDDIVAAVPAGDRTAPRSALCDRPLLFPEPWPDRRQGGDHRQARFPRPGRPGLRTAARTSTGGDPGRRRGAMDQRRRGAGRGLGTLGGGASIPGGAR